jgi:N-acetyl-anhydromuramyl-L-alanine amidase AmpD
MGRSHARQVFGVLAEGLGVEIEGERVKITPWPEAGPLTTAEVTVASDDYPAAHWVAAHEKNYTPAIRTAQEIDTIVIHTTEGSYNSVLNWFSRPEAGSSGHYIIRSSDGDVTQMVRDQDIAWHAGNWDVNSRSIGIEHEAFVNDPSWYTGAMYATSAKLVRHLAQKYDIPLDRQHIIGHIEVPGCPNPGGGGASCHTDPGQYWDWNAFMALVTAGITDTVPPPMVTYTGTIQLQARTVHSGTTLYLLDGPCPSLQPTIAASAKPVATTTVAGQFSLTLAETEGERCLFGHQLNFLAVQRSLSAQTNLGMAVLLTGDVNNDGRVNILDLSIISLKYNTANTAVDLNEDGIVNIVDLALTAHNFGRTGPVEWPGNNTTAN